MRITAARWPQKLEKIKLLTMATCCHGRATGVHVRCKKKPRKVRALPGCAAFAAILNLFQFTPLRATVRNGESRTALSISKLRAVAKRKKKRRTQCARQNPATAALIIDGARASLARPHSSPYAPHCLARMDGRRTPRNHTPRRCSQTCCGSWRRRMERPSALHSADTAAAL